MIQPNYHGKIRISINKAIGTIIHRVGWRYTSRTDHSAHKKYVTLGKGFLCSGVRVPSGLPLDTHSTFMAESHRITLVCHFTRELLRSQSINKSSHKTESPMIKFLDWWKK
jgi:hypothetical protein